jgi:acyl-CoA thioester hydrolase
MGKIYRCEMEVRGYELDSYGHVNHAVYVSYLEHARWKLLEGEGITIAKFKEWGRWPVISAIEVKYLKPAFAGDKLQIETQGLEQRRVGFVLLQKIFKEGVQVLEAKVTSVTVDEKGKPTELPPEMAALWSKS